MCWACGGLGRYREAVEHARDVTGLLEGPGEAERFGLSGLPYSGVCAVAAWCLAELGDFGGALELLRQGERVAVAADHLYSRTTLAICHGYVLVHQGRLADAIAILGPATKTCREKNFAGWLMLGLSPLGYASALLGQTVEAIPLAQEAITLQEQTGALVNRAYMHMTLARVYLEAGDLDRAELSARTGLGFAERHAEHGWRGWNHWVLGEVAARRDPPDAAGAEGQYREAAQVAAELGMRPLAAHCHVGLGRLYGRLTNRQKAQEHLKTATEMFRGLDMPFWAERARAAIATTGGPR
jgi:tetratricopeptide (TPR) repeat protein